MATPPSNRRNTAVATADPEPFIQKVADTLRHPQMIENLSMSLPAGVTVDRFSRTLLNCLQVSKQHREMQLCDRQTLFIAAQRAAASGLMVDGEESVILFRKNTQKTKAANHDVYDANWQVMYKGAIKLAFNSGLVKSHKEFIVREDDYFDYQPSVMKEPDFKPLDWFDPDAGGQPRGVYSVIELSTGGKQVAFRGKKKLYDIAEGNFNIRNYACERMQIMDYGKQVWIEPGPHFEEWWKKTALLLALKSTPRSNSQQPFIQLNPFTEKNEKVSEPVAHQYPPRPIVYPTSADDDIPPDDDLPPDNVDPQTGEMFEGEPEQAAPAQQQAQAEPAVQDPTEGKSVAFNKVFEMLGKCQNEQDFIDLDSLDHWGRMDKGEAGKMRKLIEQRKKSVLGGGQ